MTTEKQREANRRNALKSTGPRSEEGKARSAQNACKHGLCADDSALWNDPETKEEIEQNIARYFDFFQPENPLEQDALEEIALCKTRLRQVHRAQTGLINDARQETYERYTSKDDKGRLKHFFDPSQCEPEEKRYLSNRLLGVAWQSVSVDLERMSRYEARLENRYRRALKQFESLRAKPPSDPDPRSSASICGKEEDTPPAPIRVPLCPSVADPQMPNEPNFDLTTPDPTPARRNGVDRILAGGRGAWVHMRSGGSKTSASGRTTSGSVARSMPSFASLLPAAV
jgi:hypothetical protein